MIGFGGKEQLLDKAKTIRKASDEAKIIIAWDGEVSDQLVKSANDEGFIRLKLPGACEPETFILNSLNTSGGKEYLKQEYDLSGSEMDTLFAEAAAAQDPHDIPFIICSNLNIAIDEFSPIVKHVAVQEKAQLAFLQEKISNIANMTTTEYTAYVMRSAETAALA